MGESMKIKFQNYNNSWIDDKNDFNNENLLYAQKIFALLQKGRSVWLESNLSIHRAEKIESHNSMASLYFRSGGTSGIKKWVRHNEITVNCAIQGLLETLRVEGEGISSWCCLPLNHVGGMMQILRAMGSRGKIFFSDYRKLLEGPLDQRIANKWISLVPTQLHRLVTSSIACENLRKFNGIFIGGSSLSEKLAQKCRIEELPLSPCYGMSETAGMVTLLDPHSFKQGLGGVGRVLPHALLSVNPTNNRIAVKAKSMCLNPVEEVKAVDQWLSTPDYGYHDSDGNWFIQGRLDRIVVTGGEKVDPHLIEKVIQQFDLVDECLIRGVEDHEWGQIIVAYITPTTIDIEKLKQFAQDRLEPYSIHKEWHLVNELPLSEMGKPNN
jgi:O-succinylbenzoic acid--CoA ligase